MKKKLLKVGKIYVVSYKDGYIDVRNQADSTSQISENLLNGTQIMKYSQEGDRCYVKFPLKSGGALSKDIGYIHKSQLKK
ncbi:hypothetical protein [Leptotrichia sp. OH3620_COT-345]|uniref:hypothetical protein n=1 Tax=Leptotrichia sp. OH3620_COT-345 TaxID=2491048 RepID=UPI000F64B194|nr:hypothetical protein [Leptotrichia sp. OH3620_COT-345]